MVKYTLAEAQAFAETRHWELSYDGQFKCYRVSVPGTAFSTGKYRSLDGAVKSMCFDNGGEFERWLIKQRQAVSA